MNAAVGETQEPIPVTLPPLIEARGIDAGYHGHPIVRNLNLKVDAGEVVALLGPNGAGKTTTILTLAGDLRPLAGEILVDGKPTLAPLNRRAKAGTGLVTEERSVFMRLSAQDNLKVGRCDVDEALRLFPELEPLLKRTAGLLSGGEQQILSLARALARSPRLLLADELSLGLAPMVVGRLLRAVREAADTTGVGALLVEQHVKQALKVADRVYVMRSGEIVLSGKPPEIGDMLESLYLAGDTDDPAYAPVTESPPGSTVEDKQNANDA
jgi:ABC-type branched-subunit amino acid transport system ATPase component